MVDRVRDTVLEGTILRGESFDPTRGRVIVEDGQIAGIEEADVPDDDIILPAFVNAHTHIGDSVAKEAGGGLTLDELVAPPDGLKHRILRKTDRDALAAAMRRSMRFMERSGTAAFLEFREGGVAGVETIREAAEGLAVDPVILGRETVAAMEAADGFGASGARDAEFEQKRNATREAGKLFGIHAGERDPHDINAALDLDPDFIVHMVHPEPLHLSRLADASIPVVVCPRSNLVTGVGPPPFEELHERTALALGTDNVMLNSPSMFREMEFAAKLSGLSASEVLHMATAAGADIAGVDCGVVEPGRDARLLVLDGDSDNLGGARDIVRGVVRRAGVDDVKRLVVPDRND